MFLILNLNLTENKKNTLDKNMYIFDLNNFYWLFSYIHYTPLLQKLTYTIYLIENPFHMIITTLIFIYLFKFYTFFQIRKLNLSHVSCINCFFFYALRYYYYNILQTTNWPFKNLWCLHNLNAFDLLLQLYVCHLQLASLGGYFDLGHFLLVTAITGGLVVLLSHLIVVVSVLVVGWWWWRWWRWWWWRRWTTRRRHRNKLLRQ